jgi:hypothetical protein
MQKTDEVVAMVSAIANAMIEADAADAIAVIVASAESEPSVENVVSARIGVNANPARIAAVVMARNQPLKPVPRQYRQHHSRNPNSNRIAQPWSRNQRKQASVMLKDVKPRMVVDVAGVAEVDAIGPNVASARSSRAKWSLRRMEPPWTFRRLCQKWRRQIRPALL